MNKAKVVNIDGLTKPEIDNLCEHDYIKVGDKYYISEERASELVAQLQANGAEKAKVKVKCMAIAMQKIIKCSHRSSQKN